MRYAVSGHKTATGYVPMHPTCRLHRRWAGGVPGGARFTPLPQRERPDASEYVVP